MRFPSMSTRRWMIGVVLAAWVAVNAWLIWALLVRDPAPLPRPTGGAVRVVLFAALACIISPALAILTLWLAIWTTAPESRMTRIFGAIIGSLVAGFAGWSSAALFLSIGYGMDGQTPLSAILMGMIGAAVQVIPGAMIAGVQK
jgi:hypothetical protein